MFKKISLWSLSIVLTVTLSACATRDSLATVVDVESGTSECNLSSTQLAAGSVAFKVTNSGEQTTEFYVLAQDQQTVLSEVENIAPELTRELIVSLTEGTYFAQCIPGMSGDGFQTQFNVTGQAQAATIDESELAEASDSYVSYVQEQVALLEGGTAEFVTAYLAGDTQKAKALYAPVRMYWERIEPVAESFGDLDPLLDLREADLEVGQKWTGWHRLEKDLWPPAGGYVALSDEEKKDLSALLTANTADLVARVATLEFEPFQMANGAKELIDEVATGKVTGEEEIWSGTDLWDFKANIEGAEKIVELLDPVVAKRNPELAQTIEKRIAEVNELLDAQRIGEGFKTYSDLSKDDIKNLAASVDRLSEALASLTSTVV